MKIALCVFPIHYELKAALAELKAYIKAAAEAGAELIVFPETCLLGLEIVGDVQTDRQICLEQDSEEFRAILRCAREHRIHVCFGFLEYEEGNIFDSAAIISKAGELLDIYRRISIGWMIPGVDEEHYCRGKRLPIIDLEGIKLGILICGDLCEEELIASLESQNPDLCLHIMARSFPITDDIQSQWDQTELPEYLSEWKRLGKHCLCVNGISTDLFRDEDDYCGGAWFIRSDGKILAAKALLERGLLFHELPLGRH